MDIFRICRRSFTFLGVSAVNSGMICGMSGDRRDSSYVSMGSAASISLLLHGMAIPWSVETVETGSREDIFS